MRYKEIPYFTNSKESSMGSDDSDTSSEPKSFPSSLDNTSRG